MYAVIGSLNLNAIFGKLSLFCLEIFHIQLPYLLNNINNNNNNQVDYNTFLNIWDVFDMNNNSKIECNNKMASLSLINIIIIYLPYIKI